METATNTDRLSCCRARKRCWRDQAYVVIDVNFACATDQDSGNVRPYAPVSPFVRISQCRPCDGLTQSHAIQLRWLCAEACFDIAQALAIRYLRERHDAKLFAATETSDANIAAIARTIRSKLVHGTKSMTCENSVRPKFTATPPDQKNRENYRKIIKPSSNRHQTKTALTYCPPSIIRATRCA